MKNKSNFIDKIEGFEGFYMGAVLSIGLLMLFEQVGGVGGAVLVIISLLLFVAKINRVLSGR